MSNLREAAQQALLAWNTVCGAQGWDPIHLMQFARLREALAQPDDKAQPVAWLNEPQFGNNVHCSIQELPDHPEWRKTPLYAAPQPPAEQENDDAKNTWRRLALQFDNHRMQALGHLRAMVADASKHAQIAAEFLQAPPLDGEAVLATRIKALAGTTTAEQGAELPNVVATAPERIYLVIGEDCPPDVDFNDLEKGMGIDDVTWCADKIDENSIEYVRVDRAARGGAA